jgi:hypothetical protein
MAVRLGFLAGGGQPGGIVPGGNKGCSRWSSKAIPPGHGPKRQPTPQRGGRGFVTPPRVVSGTPCRGAAQGGARVSGGVASLDRRLPPQMPPASQRTPTSAQGSSQRRARNMRAPVNTAAQCNRQRSARDRQHGHTADGTRQPSRDGSPAGIPRGRWAAGGDCSRREQRL